MANRRMFSLRIVDTDIFLEMAPTAQNLYFHLGMRADDDGFVNNPKKIMKVCNAAEDDFKVLVTKNFIIPMQNGICVITHWKVNNLIRPDRYNETIYKDEKQTLTLENNKYQIALPQKNVQVGIQNVIPNGYQRLTQVRLGKDSLGNKYLEGKLPKSNYALFIDLLNELTKRKFEYNDKKAQRQFEYLHKQGYKREQFTKVIQNAYEDPYHIENNFKYLTPEFLTRTNIFERYLNIKTKEEQIWYRNGKPINA